MRHLLSMFQLCRRKVERKRSKSEDNTLNQTRSPSSTEATEITISAIVNQKVRKPSEQGVLAVGINLKVSTKTTINLHRFLNLSVIFKTKATKISLDASAQNSTTGI